MKIKKHCKPDKNVYRYFFSTNCKESGNTFSCSGKKCYQHINENEVQ